MKVSFTLRGDLERLRLPGRRRRRRRDGLWRHTCFEVFCARKGSRAYREYNVSPSGEWATYAFSAYRVRARAEVPRPQVRLQRGNGFLRLELRLQETGRLRIGLSAVIEEQGGALSGAFSSYWALRHPAGRPDFHRRRAFALELA